jgi:ABC-type branched-subunit amino acid transport system ATPase component/sugar phosphate permease
VSGPGVEGAPTGQSLVLREVEGERGVPTMDAPRGRPGGRRGRTPAGAVGGLAREVRSYAELRRTPYGFTPALVLGLISFFQIFDTRAFALAGPEIVRDLELDINRLIDISRIVGFFSIFAAIYAGWYADRHRRTPFIGLGTIGSGVFSMVASRGNSLFALGAPRVLDDVSGIASGVPAFSLLADYYPPENRGKVFALLGTLDRLGALLAIFVVGLAVELLGWRTATFLFGLPLVVVGAYALVRLREPTRGYMERRAMGADDDSARRENEPQSFGEAWRTTWSIRTVRRVFISAAVGSGALGFSFYFSFYLVEKYGLGPLERSLLGLPPLLSAIVGGLYGGALVDRLIRRNPSRVLTVFGLFTVVAAIGEIGVAFGPPIPVLIVANIVFAFGFALTGPAVSVLFAQVIPPSIRTQGLQMTGLAALPGLLVFAPIAQAVFDTYGYTAVFLLDVPFLVVSAVLFTTAAGFFDLDARSAFAASLAEEEWRRAREEGGGKLLVCRDVNVSYDGVQVLFGVDFDVEEGEIIALLGTNGAGKSTLLRAISGTQEASGGAIVFDGRDITHMPPHEIAARGVIHMPGGRGVFPGLTVRENLLLANWLTEDPEEIQRGLAEVFEIFPVLRERSQTAAEALSGGEQQQLSLAQAFLARPRLLMIDELSLGLAPAVVAQLLEIVRAIHRRGVTIVVVEQSVNVALTIAEKAIFMEKGEVRFVGPTSELLARPDILRAVYVKGTGALTEGVPAGARRGERRSRELELAGARPVLQVEDLAKRYGGVTAVDGVTFDLREGEVLGLIGPNGAGKTTVFDLIGGFQVPDAGRIGYQGIDITRLTPEERAQRGLVRRFQDARLFPALTVFETLLVALEQRLEVTGTVVHAAALPPARRAERRLRARAERLVELLELGSYRDKFVKELSTGLRRIVDLACVLAAEPTVLLLDEPSSGIAQAEAEGLAPLLRRVRFETGCSILLIEHDMPLISAVSDELLALDRGRVVIRGRPDDVLNDERVVESYLGASESVITGSRRRRPG